MPSSIFCPASIEGPQFRDVQFFLICAAGNKAYQGWASELLDFAVPIPVEYMLNMRVLSPDQIFGFDPRCFDTTAKDAGSSNVNAPEKIVTEAVGGVVLDRQQRGGGRLA